MAFRADRACRHQPAIIDPADARVLDAIALKIRARIDRLAIDLQATTGYYTGNIAQLLEED